MRLVNEYDKFVVAIRMVIVRGMGKGRRGRGAINLSKSNVGTVYR